MIWENTLEKPLKYTVLEKTKQKLIELRLRIQELKKGIKNGMDNS